MKLKDAFKEATRKIYGRRTMSASGYEALKTFVHPAQEPAPEFKPNGKELEPPVVNAFVWLCSVLTNFEKENYATVEPDEMRNRMDSGPLEILANCKDWME